MKHLLLIIIGLLFANLLSAQTSISPDNPLGADASVREKIVNLALQNPDLEISDHQVKIAQYHLKEAKGWWLSNVAVSLNANEFTVKRLKGEPQIDGRQYPFYPLYNFALSIPIGGLFSKPAATKAAKEQVAIAQASRSGKYRQIRAAALSAYEDFLAKRSLYTLQSQVTEGAYNDYLQAKKKFRDGQIDIDAYDATVNKYYDGVKAKINAEHDFNVTKIQLEDLIGVPIDQVLNDFKSSGAPADSLKNE